jgi:hypothetical protein
MQGFSDFSVNNNYNKNAILKNSVDYYNNLSIDEMQSYSNA